MALPLFDFGFDEAAGNVIDLRGNGYDWALNGNAIRTASGGGKNGKGLTQSGTSIVTGPTLADLQTANRTIMGDIKTTADLVGWPLMEHYVISLDSGAWGFLMLNDGLIRIRCRNASAAFSASVARPVDNQFHNFCGTYDGTDMKLYLDGVLSATTPVAGPLRVDADVCRFFDNTDTNIVVDNVRAFDVALSPAEVVQWMNTPAGQTPSQPGGNMANSLSDIQAAKLPALSGIVGSVQDMLFDYYADLSGLVPKYSYSVTDHQRVYYIAQTGAAGSMADLEKAFYDLQAIPAGSLSDREYAYWNGLP